MIIQIPRKVTAQPLRFFVKSEPFTEDGAEGMKLVRVCMIDVAGFEVEASGLATSHVEAYGDSVTDEAAAHDMIDYLIGDILNRFVAIQLGAGRLPADFPLADIEGNANTSISFFRCEGSPCSVSL